VPYHLQLINKTAAVRAELSKAVDDAVRVDLRATVGPSEPWFQRTKVGFRITGQTGKLRAAMYRQHSRQLVAIQECPAQSEKATALAFEAIRLANELRISGWEEVTRRGVFRAVMARQAPGTGAVHVILICARNKVDNLDQWVAGLMAAGADGVSFNHHPEPGSQLMSQKFRHLAGHQRLVGEVFGVKYVISPAAFFQTSEYGVRALVDHVLDAVGQPTGTVVDLYSGAGLFSLAMAKQGIAVSSVEENAAAVADAQVAAKLNELKNVRMYTGRSVGRLRTMAKSGESPDVIVMDPPRTGCESGAVDLLCGQIKPRRIVYVSCDLRSLGRDVKALVSGGYRIKYVQPIDMFPHTNMLETIVVLEKPPAPPRLGAGAYRGEAGAERTRGGRKKKGR
jgi:23S rRNA (uracil1939-C5)-methyltransferase